MCVRCDNTKEPGRTASALLMYCVNDGLSYRITTLCASTVPLATTCTMATPL